MSRDTLFENEFLEQVVAEAARRAGVDARPYAESVRARLLVGAERYGDAAFRATGRDNLREVLEETPDVTSYSLLELQALASGDVPEGTHHHLFEASVHAAIADWHARQAKLARRL